MPEAGPILYIASELPKLSEPSAVTAESEDKKKKGPESLKL